LENLRYENELKYKRLRDKQLSIEQEKRLEEEINKKLSVVNEILNKAKVALPQSSEVEEEVKHGG
jgi:hypothetical protein